MARGNASVSKLIVSVCISGLVQGVMLANQFSLYLIVWFCALDISQIRVPICYGFWKCNRHREVMKEGKKETMTVVLRKFQNI